MGPLGTQRRPAARHGGATAGRIGAGGARAAGGAACVRMMTVRARKRAHGKHWRRRISRQSKRAVQRVTPAAHTAVPPYSTHVRTRTVCTTVADAGTQPACARTQAPRACADTRTHGTRALICRNEVRLRSGRQVCVWMFVCVCARARRTRDFGGGSRTSTAAPSWRTANIAARTSWQSHTVPPYRPVLPRTAPYRTSNGRRTIATRRVCTLQAPCAQQRAHEL